MSAAIATAPGAAATTPTAPQTPSVQYAPSQAAPLSAHCPAPLQTSGCCPKRAGPPTHLPAPGVQTPVHPPATQAWPAQAVAFCHVPDAVHVSGVVASAQPLAPGEQSPTHAPPLHACPTQAAPVCHAPVASHVWGTPRSEHRAAPGVQATHAPA